MVVKIHIIFWLTLPRSMVSGYHHSGRHCTVIFKIHFYTSAQKY